VRGPEPRVPELEIPCLERGAEPKGVGKPKNNCSGAGLGEPGVRVFKLKTKSIRGKLKEFYDMLTSLLPRDGLPKSAFRYREEWENSFIEVIHSRLATGKWLRPKRRKRGRKRVKRKSGKPIPKRPPFLLTARFILTTNERRGRTDAPVVVDLRKREVRIPCVGVAVPIPERLARALEEENRLEPRPDFVVQLTSSGALRIIAKRAPEPRALEPPLRIIAVDENSRYGFVVAVFDFDERGYCRLTRFEVFKPPNHGYREKVVSALKSFADKPAGALESVRELLPFIPTPSDAGRLARKTLARKRRLNNAFVESFVSEVRELVREASQEGAAVVILVDPIDAESLQGTPLQGTLLRVRERLENLARYEGAHFAEIRASGKLCPFYGVEGRENGHRVFRCPRCGTVWDRDRAAVANLVLRYLRTLYKEECQDADPLRLADAVQAWLKRHPGFLLRVSPVPEGAGVRHRGPSPEGAQRAGRIVTGEPAARRARRLPPLTGGRAPRRGGDAGARASDLEVGERDAVVVENARAGEREEQEEGGSHDHGFGEDPLPLLLAHPRRQRVKYGDVAQRVENHEQHRDGVQQLPNLLDHGRAPLAQPKSL